MLEFFFFQQQQTNEKMSDVLLLTEHLKKFSFFFHSIIIDDDDYLHFELSAKNRKNLSSCGGTTYVNVNKKNAKHKNNQN